MNERLSSALADRYRFERELGAGGMATVYVAEDLKHKRRVALKVLKPEVAAVIGATRFLAEISTTANLQHPHILPLHDSGEVEGSVYYVMPFVEGESLRDRLNREKQMPVAEAVRIASEVASALDYAHRKGIIHRDIKPENILLHDGRAIVADFGIALAASKSDSSARLTESGMSLGTPHYMSPEQAMGERTLDGRTDVFALGCVLYEMLTGEPPFTGPTAQAIVAKVMSSEPVPIEELRKTVPVHVAAAVHVALQKIPADRFASAAELAGALQDATRASTLLRARPGRSRNLKTLVPWAIAVAATVLMALNLGRGGRGVHPEQPIRFSFPAASAVGANDRPAISPDGRFIVYTVNEGGSFRLYRRFLDTPVSSPLTGTEGAFYPTISPDARWLAYVGADFNVYKRSFDGGPPVRIVQTTTLPAGIAWSRSHGIVLGMLAYSKNVGLGLTADTAGSAPRFITSPSGDRMHHEPFVPDGSDLALFQDFSNQALGVAHLPDGKFTMLDARVSLIVGYARGVLLYLDPASSLMAVGFDLRSGTLTSEPVPVRNAPPGIQSASMAANGTLVMQVAPDAYRLEIVDDQGAGTPLLPDTLIDVNARYSPDGSRVALAMTGRGSQGVRVYDFRTSTLSSLSPFSRSVSRLEWTPDGKRLVVSGFGSAQVDWFAADGSDQPSVLYTMPDSVKAFWAGFAPDGRDLLIGSHLGTGAANISVARLEGDSALKTVIASGSNEVAPRLSHDGQWLAYQSDESGVFQVYVRPYQRQGPPQQLTDDGGVQPMWSRDGRRLFYRVGDAMMAIDARVNPTTSQLQFGNRRKLFEGKFFGNDATRIVSFYDVAPDGRHFLMARALTGLSEIVVWVNWLDELTDQIRSSRK